MRKPICIQDSKVKRVPELPDDYVNIRTAYFTKKKPEPPSLQTPKPIVQGPSLLRPHFSPEYEWLEKAHVTEDIDNTVSVTWSDHHESQKRGNDFQVSIASLLPLLRDEAHSVASIKHVMDKIKDTVTLLNPGQTPVLAADQPIYSLIKQIQWHWPECYGEDKFLAMSGGLHIEMAALCSIGTLL